jgi:hypothetical protein
MNITHDDTATSWRDLTDQLTPEQVRRFEHFAAMALNAKRDAAPDEHDTADELLTGLLTKARWEAQQNLTDAMIGYRCPTAPRTRATGTTAARATGPTICRGAPARWTGSTRRCNSRRYRRGTVRRSGRSTSTSRIVTTSRANRHASSPPRSSRLPTSWSGSPADQPQARFGPPSKRDDGPRRADAPSS